MTTMFKGVIHSWPDKRTLCNLPHAPVCCFSAIIFGETPRRQTQAITHRSYNHQNKPAGIRVCPVTTPFNKRLRKPQKVAMHWAALKVTTKFSECSPLRRSQKKASEVMWRYFWPRGNLLASHGVLCTFHRPSYQTVRARIRDDIGIHHGDGSNKENGLYTPSGPSRAESRVRFRALSPLCSRCCDSLFTRWRPSVGNRLSQNVTRKKFHWACPHVHECSEVSLLF